MNLSFSTRFAGNGLLSAYGRTSAQNSQFNRGTGSAGNDQLLAQKNNQHGDVFFSAQKSPQSPNKTLHFGTIHYLKDNRYDLQGLQPGARLRVWLSGGDKATEGTYLGQHPENIRYAMFDDGQAVSHASTSTTSRSTHSQPAQEKLDMKDLNRRGIKKSEVEVFKGDIGQEHHDTGEDLLQIARKFNAQFHQDQQPTFTEKELGIIVNNMRSEGLI